MLIFKCDSTIYIINVYETTIIIYTTRYVQYVLEYKLCASVQNSVLPDNYEWCCPGYIRVQSLRYPFHVWQLVP